MENKIIKNKTILSGIQPSGILHLGNYFGAIKQYIELQNENKCYFFIANYHAMTTLKDSKELYRNTLDVASHYIALGLDPSKACLFVQSDIPEVTELTWFLSVITPMGLLERCHSYKDKIAKGVAPDHGLFSYPVLMASDILMYKPDLVPVGKDQKQHVEVARDIAIKFNNTYGEVFKIPDVLIRDETSVVPGIDGQKMSKSYNNYISFLADEKIVKKQVMSIITDSTPLEEPKDPDKCNVFNLYKLLANKDEIEELRTKYLNGGFGYGDAKKLLLSKILDYFKEARVKYEEIKNDEKYIITVLKNGALKAREHVNPFMKEIREKIGIFYTY